MRASVDHNKTVLAANPSFITAQEAAFWKQLEAVLLSKGWTLIKHAMRSIPANELTIILPARLADVAHFLPPLPSARAAKLPEWFPEDRFRLLVDWELRRWSLNEHNPLIDGGLLKLAWHVDGLFQNLRPAVTVYTNKIDHGTAMFQWAASHYGCEEVFLERSPLESFIVESTGMFGESDVWEKFKKRNTKNDELYKTSGSVFLDFLKENPEGFRKQNLPEALAKKELSKLNGPIALLPMDNVLWTGWAQKEHWQKSVDYGSSIPSPAEAIRHLAKIIGRKGGTLIIKLHPSDVEKYPKDIENVLFLEAPLSLLLRASDVCITFLTKVAFVSVAMAKPTVCLARNTVAASEAVIYEMNPDKWEGAVSDALSMGPEETAASQQKMALLLGWLDREFYLRNNQKIDLSRPNVFSLFDSLANSQTGTNSYGNTKMKMQSEKLVKAIMDRKAWAFHEIDLKEPEGDLFIIFDVSRLANTKLMHSGISRYATQLFDALRGIDGVCVIPVLMYPDVMNRGDFRDNLAEFSKFIGEQVVRLNEAIGRVKNKRSVYFSPYDPLPDVTMTPGVPRIVTVHDVLHITMSELYTQDNVAMQINGVLKSICPSDLVFTDSEYTRMQLLRVFDSSPEMVVTVPLGVNEIFYPRPKAEVDKYLVSLGLKKQNYFVSFVQNDPRKNFPITLEAIKDYVNNSSDAKTSFAIICSAVHLEGLQCDLDAINLPKNRIVLIAGPSDDELARLYTRARGFIFPSLGEGFGLPPLEAMRCGCPVIASAVTSIPEVVGNAGLYVDGFQKDSIVNAIAMLASSDSLHTQLRTAGLKRSQQFSWPRVAKEFKTLAAGLSERLLKDVFLSGDELLCEENWVDISARDPSLWKNGECTIENTERLFFTGRGYQNSIIVCENDKNYVHRIAQQINTDTKQVIFSSIVRGAMRRFAKFFVQPLAEEEPTGQGYVYIDLADGTVVDQRGERGIAIESVSVRPLLDGWVLVRVHFTWEVDTNSIRISINSRQDKFGSNKFVGELSPAIEVSDSVILVPKEKTA